MKKFKVRITYFSSGYYTVDYVHYRWFYLFWKSLHYWFAQGHPGGTQCWSISLFRYEKAEEMAASLKTIEDVRNYYKEENRKMYNWYEDERKWREENIPYKSKITL